MESQHPAELRVVKRVRMMGVKVTLFLLTVSKGAINTIGTLLDGDFPSSILLAALLPPEPDDDHSESYMLNVPRSKNVFRRIYILYFVFHFTHHFLFQTSTGKSMFCFVIIAITWPLIPWHCYDDGAEVRGRY